jgi:peptide-methionine (S)-S-oxide reductase
MMKSWFSKDDQKSQSPVAAPAGFVQTTGLGVGQSAANTIVVGGGCFWCTEAVFLAVRGVVAVASGYSGGTQNDPDYESICTGTTGHAEVVSVEFDPKLIDLKTLYQIFFATHDPTTLNRQGYDSGTQYRSVVFTLDQEQDHVARALRAELEASKVFSSAIVTEIVALDRFWIAEAYHQNYFEKNPYQGYCMGVVAPKVAKFRKQFARYLK